MKVREVHLICEAKSMANEDIHYFVAEVRLCYEPKSSLPTGLNFHTNFDTMGIILTLTLQKIMRCDDSDD